MDSNALSALIVSSDAWPYCWRSKAFSCSNRDIRRFVGLGCLVRRNKFILGVRTNLGLCWRGVCSHLIPFATQLPQLGFCASHFSCFSISKLSTCLIQRVPYLFLAAERACGGRAGPSGRHYCDAGVGADSWNLLAGRYNGIPSWASISTSPYPQVRARYEVRKRYRGRDAGRWKNTRGYKSSDLQDLNISLISLLTETQTMNTNPTLARHGHTTTSLKLRLINKSRRPESHQRQCAPAPWEASQSWNE